MWPKINTSEVQVIKLPEVIYRTKISRSNIYRLIKESKFPAPSKLIQGGRSSGWLLSEIENYINDRFTSKADK